MRFKAEQSACAMLPAFTYQPQVPPDSGVGDCQVDTNSLISGRRKTPTDRATNVVTLSNTARHVLLRQIDPVPDTGSVMRSRKQTACKFFHRIGPDRFQQVPARDFVGRIQCNHDSLTRFAMPCVAIAASRGPLRVFPFEWSSPAIVVNVLISKRQEVRVVVSSRWGVRWPMTASDIGASRRLVRR